MKRKKKSEHSDDPKPLDFDHDEEKGSKRSFKKPFMTPEDEEGTMKMINIMRKKRPSVPKR